MNVLRALYIRLYLSRLYSRLESANLSYSNQASELYIEKMTTFYSNLQAFKHAYTNNRIEQIYTQESDLLMQMETAIVNSSAKELYDLSYRTRILLDNLFDSALSFQSFTFSASPYFRAGIAAVLITFIFAAFYSPLKKRYHTEKEEYDLIANEDIFKQRTKQDIFQLQEALNRYHQDNRSYPKSSGGWDAIIAIYGQSKDDWIPGLVPKYIKKLPSDPRKAKDPVKQYMYKSDGTDYKLIAHFPVGMDDIIKEYPQFVDPRRPSWAFGVWTEAAKNW